MSEKDNERGQNPDEGQDQAASSDLSRRDFVTMSVAAGLGLAASSASAAPLPVVEKTVEIKTPDGTCDAAFIHPATGSHPGVLIWPDAFGLRPSMRDIGKRLAAEGYSVLVPNPFYRVAKAPVFDDASKFNFANPTDRAKLQPLMGSINAAGAAEKDAAAFVAFLDAQPQVEQGEEDRHAGLLHGRPAGREDRGGGARSRRRRRVVPRRRPGDRQARQPAPARAEDQGADVLRHRVERRHAPARREGQADAKRSPRRKVPAEIEVYPRAARLVRAGHAEARTARRSTTSRTPRARGPSWSRCTRPRSPELGVRGSLRG